jgi:predicted  nucleic acid-binding Zn-ribbon protein
MDILAALRQEEEKWKKQANAAQQQLDTVRAAIKLLGGMDSSGKTTGRKKRVLSAAARAKISKATKERWAKFRAAKAKGKH